MLHGVAHETRKVFSNVKAVAVGGTEKDVVAHEVRHGEVQPDVTLALDAFVDPFHRLLVNRVNYRVTCPHNFNRLVHVATKRAEVTALFVCPTAVVFRRTHYERTNVALRLHEIRVDVVEKVCLLVSLCAFAPNVVEEYGERAHTKLIHGFELVHHGVTVSFCPLDIHPGVNCPVEVYTVLVCCIKKHLKACCFFGGIRHAPLVAVVGVVLRTVDVNVHLVLRVEVELRKAVFLAPGSAIETFNYATERHVGEVGDDTSLQLAILHHSEERLYAVERTAFVSGSNNNLLVSHLEVITFCLCGDEFLILLNSLLIAPTEGYLKGCLGRNGGSSRVECVKGIRRSDSLVSNYRPFCGNVNQELRKVFYLLRNGVDVAHLCLRNGCAEAEEGSKNEFLVHNY